MFEQAAAPKPDAEISLPLPFAARGLVEGLTVQ
jgi:hypothetical protein